MIEKRNKLDAAVSELDQQEAAEKDKTKEVVKRIAGRDGKGGRKVLPTYIPWDLYMEFDKLSDELGLSKNSVICLLIRQFVESNKDLLQ